jgi:hypothetical protein
MESVGTIHDDDSQFARLAQAVLREGISTGAAKKLRRSRPRFGSGRFQCHASVDEMAPSVRAAAMETFVHTTRFRRKTPLANLRHGP